MLVFVQVAMVAIIDVSVWFATKLTLNPLSLNGTGKLCVALSSVRKSISPIQICNPLDNLKYLTSYTVSLASSVKINTLPRIKEIGQMKMLWKICQGNMAAHIYPY